MSQSRRQLRPFWLPGLTRNGRSWQLAALLGNGLLRTASVVLLFFLIRRNVSALAEDQMLPLGQWVLIPLLGLALGLLRRHERATAESLGQAYANRLRARMLKRLFRTPLDTARKRTVGSLSVRMGSDLAAVRRWISFGLVRLSINAMLVCGCALALLPLDWRLSLGLLMLLGLLGLAALRLSVKMGQSLQAVRRSRGRLQSSLVERLQQLAGIRAMGQARRETRRIIKLSGALRDTATGYGRQVGSLRGLSEGGAVALVAAALALGYGPWFAHLSVSDLAAIMSLMLFLGSPIRELARVQEYYRGAAVALTKVSDLLCIPVPKRIRRHRGPFPAPGRICYRSITCGEVIDGFSAVIEPGERVALFGPNGAGKSSLIRVTLGLSLPRRGRVKMHGVALARISPLDLARSVGVAGSDYGLLKGSLQRNLCYRWPGIDPETVARVVETCGLTPLVSRMPDGLASIITESAHNLSAGERQRIGLARALMGQPEILLLDEPETSLDAPGLSLLNKLIESYPGTILLATHNEALARRCSQRWQMPLTGAVNLTSGGVQSQNPGAYQHG